MNMPSRSTLSYVICLCVHFFYTRKASVNGAHYVHTVPNSLNHLPARHSLCVLLRWSNKGWRKCDLSSRKSRATICITIRASVRFQPFTKGTKAFFIRAAPRLSGRTKWQWRIVCLRGECRTMVHGGVSKCNTLYQTQIYWFVHSAASPGHKSRLTVTPTVRAIC